ncbi:MAG: glutamate 5-kinase, partial [Pygmaiobacter sp.]
DIENEHHRRNIENTLQRLLDYDVVPIVNENDTIATEEIQIGDNDTLSAIVATLAKADRLILLSDIEGLYDANPKENPSAKLIPFVEEIDESILALAGGAGSAFGTGGMQTKLRAGLLANGAGIPMIIMDGRCPELLYDAVEGRPVGTWFGKRS